MRALVWKLIRHAPATLAITLFVWIALSCLPIVTGIVQQGIFDGLQFKTEIQHVVLLFVALAALRVLQPATAVLWIWLHHTVEPRMEALVRTNLVQWVMDESGRSKNQQTPIALLGHVRDDVPCSWTSSTSGIGSLAKACSLSLRLPSCSQSMRPSRL